MHETLSDMVVDLVQNSIESGADTVRVVLCEEGSFVTAVIEDNGKGMDAATLRRIEDPFFSDGVKHPGREVGLGVPFLLQLVEAVGGSHEITSVPGKGTRVEFSLSRTHVDLPPIGALDHAICTALGFDGGYEMIVERARDGLGYQLRRSDLKDVLGELESVEARVLLSRFIQSQEESLREKGGQDGKDDA